MQAVLYAALWGIVGAGAAALLRRSAPLWVWAAIGACAPWWLTITCLLVAWELWPPPPKGATLMNSNDAMWFEMTEPTNDLKTPGIMVGEGSLTRDKLVQIFTARLLKFPPFRRCAKKSRWTHYMEECAIDMNYHIVSTTLPTGSMAEFKAAIGDALGTPLDWSKPLWRVWHYSNVKLSEVSGAATEGSPVGWGIVFVSHHCLVDGIAFSQVVNFISDLDPTAPIETSKVPEDANLNKTAKSYTLLNPVVAWATIKNALNIPFCTDEPPHVLRKPALTGKKLVSWRCLGTPDSIKAISTRTLR
eukprot:TRINITY_DN512_c0_g1_i2.p1 TRINITY_DN512_c0_g1~~TRINITY_DN512_c0_g1_i2.p1  ORF type:complete len:318 (-),score=47.23 TRINITY_DN512_c0_g1_i2:12-920(-)